MSPRPKPREGVETNTPTSPVGRPAAPAGYDFAVNVVKLNRAITYVQTNEDTRGLTGAAKSEAVKARYVALGGLLKQEKHTPAQKGETVNMADHDGSADTTEDEDDDA